MTPIFAIPTANRELASATFAKWKARGYSTAAFTDADTGRPDHCDIWIYSDFYRGWPWATNTLMAECFRQGASWCVGGGDDIDPADADPLVIAAECEAHFGGTMGVMQPTGDRWLEDENGEAAADRICGSPWIGRDFFQFVDGGQGMGKGVLCERFRHFFADELLKIYAQAGGFLWQRRDLTQIHHHPARTGAQSPAYARVNQDHWAEDQKVFLELVGRKREEKP